MGAPRAVAGFAAHPRQVGRRGHGWAASLRTVPQCRQRTLATLIDVVQDRAAVPLRLIQSSEHLALDDEGDARVECLRAGLLGLETGALQLVERGQGARDAGRGRGAQRPAPSPQRHSHAE